MRLQLPDNYVEALISEMAHDRVIVVESADKTTRTPLTGRLIQAALMEQSAASNESRTALNPYVKAAKRQYARDGDLEFDDDAIVSAGEDPGAYVMAWKWVEEELADAIAAAQRIIAAYPEGKCPDCGLTIDEDQVHGGECGNCPHVFNDPEHTEDDDGE